MQEIILFEKFNTDANNLYFSCVAKVLLGKNVHISVTYFRMENGLIFETGQISNRKKIWFDRNTILKSSKILIYMDSPIRIGLSKIWYSVCNDEILVNHILVVNQDCKIFVH